MKPTLPVAEVHVARKWQPPLLVAQMFVGVHVLPSPSYPA